MQLLRALKTLSLLVLLCGLASPAPALDFNAFWLYRNTGGEGRDTREEFQERYTLGVGPQVTWRPTHALTATGNISYTRIQRDRGGNRGMETEEQLTPSATLNLYNDIFTAGLAGSVSRYDIDSEPSTTDRAWDAVLASTWNIPLWPTLRFSYGEQDSDLNFSDQFERSDRMQATSSAEVDWDLVLARFHYRYSTTRDEDRDTGDHNDTKTHFVKGETDGRLFSDRFTYRLSQQYQVTDQSGVTFGEVELAGQRLVKAADQNDLAPNEPGYEDPAQNPPLSVDPLNRIHLLFGESTGLAQQIDVLRLAFDFFGAQVAPLQWDLYQRIGDDWVPVPGPVTAVYNSAEDYLEIPVNLSANEILLVSGPNLSGETLVLTDFRAYELLLDDGGESLSRSDSTNTNYLTNAAFGFRLTRTLSASVNMTLEQLEGETDRRTFDQLESVSGRTEQETLRRTVSGRLLWSPLFWLSSSLGFSETYEESESQQFTDTNPFNESERTNRAYSLTLSTRPLPTMNVTFGITKNESDFMERTRSGIADQSARERIGDGLQYSLSTTAQIYPDLNATVFMTYLVRDDEIRESRALGDGTRERVFGLSDTRTFSVRSNIIARLARDLTADLGINYRTSDRTNFRETFVDEVPDDERREKLSNESADTTLNLQYRPSVYLSLRGFYTAYFLDSTQENILGAGLSLAVLRTQKARLTLNYNFVHAEETSNNVGMNGSWDISRNLSLQSRASYTLADVDFYSFQASLNLRL